MTAPRIDEETSRAHLDRTRWTQPALFALEHALATLWLSWGVEPAYVFGHSIGVYAAVVSAGSFDLETGLQLVAERGRLMDGLPEGGAIGAPAAVVNAINDALSPFGVSIDELPATPQRIRAALRRNLAARLQT